jgi:predicted dehydrogenase
MSRFMADHGVEKVPPFYGTLDEFLAANKGPADCAVIATPHNLHAPQAIACMRAGMDVLLEKPMVLNAAEARRVMAVRDETGRLFSVAFPGCYSPAIHKAKELLAAGEIGRVMSIATTLIQPWVRNSTGTWRQVPEISGGGFLFDTGAHAISVMLDLAGADVKELVALQDNRGLVVDVTTVVAGRFKNGVHFTLCAEGGSSLSKSGIMVAGTEGVLTAGFWGEYVRVAKKGAGEKDVEFEGSRGEFERFMLVREGRLANPCPAEFGLRQAKFLEMVRKAVKNNVA